MQNLFLVSVVAGKPIRLTTIAVINNSVVAQHVDADVQVICGTLEEKGVLNHSLGLAPFETRVEVKGEGWYCWFTDKTRAELAVDYYKVGQADFKLDSSSAGYM